MSTMIARSRLGPWMVFGVITAVAGALFGSPACGAAAVAPAPVLEGLDPPGVTVGETAA
jgi:hypothetical protein